MAEQDQIQKIAADSAAWHRQQIVYNNTYIKEAQERNLFHESEAKLLDSVAPKVFSIVERLTQKPPVVAPPIVSPVTSLIVCVVPKTLQKIPVVDGSTFAPNTLKMCDIEAFPGITFEKSAVIEFYIDSQLVKKEQAAPYTLSGVTYGPAFGAEVADMPKGIHTIQVVAKNGAGILQGGRAIQTVSFTVA